MRRALLIPKRPTPMSVVGGLTTAHNSDGQSNNAGDYRYYWTDSPAQEAGTITSASFYCTGYNDTIRWLVVGFNGTSWVVQAVSNFFLASANGFRNFDVNLPVLPGQYLGLFTYRDGGRVALGGANPGTVNGNAQPFRWGGQAVGRGYWFSPGAGSSSQGNLVVPTVGYVVPSVTKSSPEQFTGFGSDLGMQGRGVRIN